MPSIHFDGIADKSSEDSKNQLIANNLLRIKDFKSWKCKEWEDTAFVILEVKEPQKIDSIEIGNDCSSFIEVLVANSSDPKPRFQVLLSTSSFMTPSDSKSMTNCNRIRDFPKDKLSPNARNEKWDRFKIVCKQPFNREISFGLAFVRFNSSGGSDEEMDTTPTKINFGPFRLRSEVNDNNDSEPNSGSMFARRNNQSNESVNPPKRTSLSSAVGLTPNSKPQKTKQNSDEMKNKQTKTSQIPPKTTQRTPPNNPSPSSSTAGRHSDPSPPKRSRRVAEIKPFNQLMSGVVFTLSGFVNPKRSEIRDKAIKMGAKYRPDWDQSCTHLICAFANTPKFNDVKSKKGRIVTEKWIHDSFNQKKLMIWKRYTFGQTSDDEDDDEDFEDEDDDYVPPVLNNKKIQYIDDDEEEEQMQEVIGFGHNTNNNDLNDEIYDMETDESTGADNNNITKPSSNDNNSDQKEGTPPKSIDIFKERCFWFSGSFEDQERELLTQYITSHNGKLEKSLSDKVKYVVTNSEWNDNFEEACLSNESLIFVKPKWIVKCHQNSKLIPFQPFIVSANYD